MAEDPYLLLYKRFAVDKYTLMAEEHIHVCIVLALTTKMFNNFLLYGKKIIFIDNNLKLMVKRARFAFITIQMPPDFICNSVSNR